MAPPTGLRHEARRNVRRRRRDRLKRKAKGQRPKRCRATALLLLTFSLYFVRHSDNNSGLSQSVCNDGLDPPNVKHGEAMNDAKESRSHSRNRALKWMVALCVLLGIAVAAV